MATCDFAPSSTPAHATSLSLSLFLGFRHCNRFPLTSRPDALAVRETNDNDSDQLLGRREGSYIRRSAEIAFGRFATLSVSTDEDGGCHVGRLIFGHGLSVAKHVENVRNWPGIREPLLNCQPGVNKVPTLRIRQPLNGLVGNHEIVSCCSIANSNGCCRNFLLILTPCSQHMFRS